MAFSSSSSSLSASPNVTPLIDVLLVLLIIFMTIVPLSPRGLESSIPQAAPVDAVSESTPVILEVKPSSAPHEVAYLFNGRKQDLEELRTSLREANAHSTSGVILIAGDPQLDYQPVVTAIGEARRAGFRSIGLLPRAAVSRV